MYKKTLLKIIILAAALRLLFLPSSPPSLNWDEVAMGYTAHSIAETGMDEWGEKLPLVFRSYGEWKSPVYIYLLVPFIKLLGVNAWAVRLPTSLAGIAVVYLTYLLTKKIFNEKAALWASFFMAVSPWHVLLSRPAFEAGISLFLVLLGIYNLILASERNGYKEIIISAIALGLGPHTYNSAKIITPFIVLWLIYKLKDKLKPKKILLLLSILAIFALPIAKEILSGKAQHRYTQVGVTTDIELTTEFFRQRKAFPLPENINRFIFNRYTFFAYKLVDNWATYFSPAFLVVSGGTHTQHGIPYRGVLLISEFILAMLGIYHLSKQKHPLKYLPFVILGLGFIPPATTRETHHVLRSILALPGWQILAGLGGYYLFSSNSKLKKIIKYALVVEIVILAAAYFTWYPKSYAKDWQYGYKEAFEYTESVKNNYEQIIFTKWYGEPQLFLGFYTQMDPSYYQEQNKLLSRYEDEGHIWLDQLEEYDFGKYRFQYLEWRGPDENARNLYVGKADDFYLDTEPLHTVYFPDNSVAFYIVEGP